jgi:hypothetical protein
MIDNFLKDNELYLSFLEISDGEVPVKNEKLDLQELCKLVEKKFRRKARILHPDFGGNVKDFQFLLKCKQAILEHEEKEKLISFSFDKNVDGYNDKKIASQLGNQIFELISSWSHDLKIKAIKKPSKSEDDNEWTFNILDTDKQLSLNIQTLSDEFQELSKNTYNDNSLNILVCLFVPSKKLTSIKNCFNNSTTLKFNDLILLETTNSSDLSKYLSDKNNLNEDILKIKNNSFLSRENNELRSRTSEEAKEKDKQIFKKLSELKLFNTVYNEGAADFIDRI